MHLCNCDKIPDENNINEKMFILALNFRSFRLRLTVLITLWPVPTQKNHGERVRKRKPTRFIAA